MTGYLLTEEQAVEAWLCAFNTGVSSAITNFGGLPGEVADEAADRLTAALANDPIIRAEIAEVFDIASGKIPPPPEHRVFLDIHISPKEG